MNLSQLYGWNRIFLFYGLIFFLLGFAGFLLNEELFLNRIDWGFHQFAADLEPYMRLGKPVANREVAVLSPGANAGVCFWYTADLPEAGFEPVIRQCRVLLQSRVGYVELKTAGGDEKEVGQRCAREYPGYLIIGLDAKRLYPAKHGYRIDLNLGMLNLPAPLVMEQIMEALGDRSRISFQVQPRPGECLKVSWQEGKDGKGITAVVTVLAELLQNRMGQEKERAIVLQ